MNINLHIERLVLDGLPVDSRSGSSVGDGIRTELKRLLEANGRSANFVDAATLHAAQIPIAPGCSASALGRQIARSIYGGNPAMDGRERGS